MDNTTAIYFLLMVSLVLGVGNTYYIVKYLIRTTRTRLQESSTTNKHSNKPRDIKD